jgi:DNA-binding response OmpR family regulator
LTERIDILILDDNKDISFMMESILKYAGYKTHACDTREQLYAVLAESLPRMILMDMLLAGADGKDICRDLKANTTTRSIPVLMISAHPDAGIACKDAGADEFLEKPFEMDQFLSKTKVLVNGKSPEVK